MRKHLYVQEKLQWKVEGDVQLYDTWPANVHTLRRRKHGPRHVDSTNANLERLVRLATAQYVEPKSKFNETECLEKLHGIDNSSKPAFLKQLEEMFHGSVAKIRVDDNPPLPPPSMEVLNLFDNRTRQGQRKLSRVLQRTQSALITKEEDDGWTPLEIQLNIFPDTQEKVTVLKDMEGLEYFKGQGAPATEVERSLSFADGLTSSISELSRKLTERKKSRVNLKVTSEAVQKYTRRKEKIAELLSKFGGCSVDDYIPEEEVQIRRRIQYLLKKWEVSKNVLSAFCRQFVCYSDLLKELTTVSDELIDILHSNDINNLYKSVILNLRNKELDNELETLDGVYYDTVENYEAHIEELEEVFRKLEEEKSRNIAALLEKTRRIEDLELGSLESAQQNIKLMKDMEKIQSNFEAQRANTRDELESRCARLEKELKGQKDTCSELKNLLDEVWTERQKLYDQLKAADSNRQAEIQAVKESMEAELDELPALKVQLAKFKATQNAEREATKRLEERTRKMKEKLDVLESATLTARPDYSLYSEVFVPEERTVATVARLVDMLKSQGGELRSQKDEVARLQQFLGLLGRRDTAEVEHGPDPRKFFTGLGLGQELPKFLRSHGKYRNRKLVLRELLTTMEEFWEWRTKKREGIPPHALEPMNAGSESFYDWLKSKFGINGVIMEWAYNLYFTMKRHVGSTLWCSLQIQVLDGDLPECVWYHQNELLGKLQREFQEHDMNAQDFSDIAKRKKSGLLTKEALQDAFDEAFSYKADIAYSRLFMLARDTGKAKNGLFDYTKLFSPVEGSETPFVAEFREQYMDERDSYLQDIQRIVDSYWPSKKDQVQIAPAKLAVTKYGSGWEKSWR